MPSGARSALSREAVLEAAAELVRRHGPDVLTMRDHPHLYALMHERA